MTLFCLLSCILSPSLLFNFKVAKSAKIKDQVKFSLKDIEYHSHYSNNKRFV